MKVAPSIQHCPDCKARGGVTDTRVSSGGALRRRRCCPKCKCRWSTVEQIVGKTRLGGIHTSKFIEMQKERMKDEVREEMHGALQIILGMVGAKKQSAKPSSRKPNMNGVDIDRIHRTRKAA